MVPPQSQCSVTARGVSVVGRVVPPHSQCRVTARGVSVVTVASPGLMSQRGRAAMPDVRLSTRTCGVRWL